MTTTMKAIGLYKALPIEHPDALIDIDVSMPKPDALDILVRVEAISVNPADYRVRTTKADDGELVILGWDVAGVVVATGSKVSNDFSVGDEVYYAGDLTRAGANSEYHVVDSRIVGHRPNSCSVTEAAAIPLTALTAWECLFDRIGFSQVHNERFKTLLIVGGAGGTGSMAIQLAKLIPNLKIIATASRPESQAWCRSIGADEVINHFGDMQAQLATLDLSSVDAILIFNDPDKHFATLAEIIAAQGTICSIVPFTTAPNINAIMRKSVTFVWEFMFTRSMFHTADISAQRDILNAVANLIDTGQIKSAATQDMGTINAHNIRTAHQQLESKRTIGKLTLTGF